MAQQHQQPTDAELAVLEHLWTQRQSTIREITDALYPGGTTAHYATVQKLLERLEAKGHVRRDASRIPHRFSASVGRAKLIRRRLRAMADQLCGGSLAPLLTNLVQSRALSPDEIAQLRQLVDQLDRKPRPPRRAR